MVGDLEQAGAQVQAGLHIVQLRLLLDVAAEQGGEALVLQPAHQGGVVGGLGRPEGAQHGEHRLPQGEGVPLGQGALGQLTPVQLPLEGLVFQAVRRQGKLRLEEGLDRHLPEDLGHAADVVAVWVGHRHKVQGGDALAGQVVHHHVPAVGGPGVDEAGVLPALAEDGVGLSHVHHMAAQAGDRPCPADA